MGDAARSRPVETNRLVERVVAAQLKPDGGPSRLLSRRSRAGTQAFVDRHAVPRTDVTVLGQWRPPARVLLQLVPSSTLVELDQDCRFGPIACKGLALLTCWSVRASLCHEGVRIHRVEEGGQAMSGDQ